jgi:hypothetical protein
VLALLSATTVGVDAERAAIAAEVLIAIPGNSSLACSSKTVTASSR